MDVASRHVSLCQKDGTVEIAYLGSCGMPIVGRTTRPGHGQDDGGAWPAAPLRMRRPAAPRHRCARPESWTDQIEDARLSNQSWRLSRVSSLSREKLVHRHAAQAMARVVFMTRGLPTRLSTVPTYLAHRREHRISKFFPFGFRGSGLFKSGDAVSAFLEAVQRAANRFLIPGLRPGVASACVGTFPRIGSRKCFDTCLGRFSSSCDGQRILSIEQVFLSLPSFFRLKRWKMFRFIRFRWPCPDRARHGYSRGQALVRAADSRSFHLPDFPALRGSNSSSGT